MLHLEFCATCVRQGVAMMSEACCLLEEFEWQEREFGFAALFIMPFFNGVRDDEAIDDPSNNL